jgi:endonuclease YncB( thermonuclease family)
MKFLSTLGIMCFVLFTGCGQTDEFQWAKGETGRVTRVLDGDTFALESGQIVKLANIEAPSTAFRDRPEMPFAGEAKTIMETLALGRSVQLYYPGITRDRYGRAIAQVYVRTETDKEIWLNEALILRGAAWVRIYPDTSNGSDILWSAEAAARASETGLWHKDSPAQDQLTQGPEDGMFVISRARLGEAALTENDCHQSLKDTGITVIYPAILPETCMPVTGDLTEVRGWLRRDRLYASSSENLRPVHATSKPAL